MFCHQELLLVRHKGAEDKPFVAFDKETLKPVEDDEPFTYAAGEADVDTLKWTPMDTEYAENIDEGNRWYRYAPLFSDGELIYTLVQYRKKEFSSAVVRTVLEIYELEDRVLKRREEIILYKNEAKDNFVGSKKKADYMKKGSIACNGQTLLWHSNHNWHAFDLSTGVRVLKEHMNSTALISTYDAKENTYYHMDAACYSWLKKWKVSGFKPRVLTKEVKELPDLPVVLDAQKAELLHTIAEIKKANEKKEGEENKQSSD